MRIDLRGTFLPVTTPFDPVSGDVDVVAFRANLRKWFAHPVRGLLIAGSTGESVFLDDGELAALMEAAGDVVPEDRLVIVGTGAESTRAAITKAKKAADAGADAVLVKPPAYFKGAMTPEALTRHYRAVADASPVEIAGCTLAGRTRVDRLCAENSVFAARVTVARLQEGCVRYSVFTANSTVPRPYRCQPQLAVEAAPPAQAAAVRARLVPSFTTLALPQPGYAQLSASCAAEITTGADDGNEMGAWHFLLQAHRQANASGQVEAYLRFGMQAGLAYAT